MEFRDPNQSESFKFHYNRAERLSAKHARTSVGEKREFKLLGFNLSSHLAQTFLNFVLIVAFIAVIRVWILPSTLDNSLYTIQTKELAFKDELFVEIVVTPRGSQSISLTILVENTQGTSERWQGTSDPARGAQTLHFTLPKSIDKTYRLFVQEAENKPVITNHKVSD